MAWFLVTGFSLFRNGLSLFRGGWPSPERAPASAKGSERAAELAELLVGPS